jgi:glutaredoxin-related protein
MFYDKLICKGIGFNCSSCKDKNTCDQYVESKIDYENLPILNLSDIFKSFISHPYFDHLKKYHWVMVKGTATTSNSVVIDLELWEKLMSVKENHEIINNMESE